MKNLLFFSFLLLMPFICVSQSLDKMELLNQNAPQFSLINMEGKTVSLSSFKGKTVVINFWATWCVPCHENFPIMQKVVNHYKNNENVVFLFIDTRERSQDYFTLAAKDMEKHKYNFNVLFDLKGEDGQQNKYYNEYKMAGIPTQFFIDRNGIIRYKLEGYNGKITTSQAVEQLESIITKVESI